MRSDADLMQDPSLTGPEADLVAQVVAACQAAIGRALAEPSEAFDIARGFQGALSTLQLVDTEVAKGEGGNKFVVDHADSMFRAACSDVLRFMSDPTTGLAALGAVPSVRPRHVSTAAEGPMSVMPGSGAMPTFGQVSSEYIATRIGATREDHPEIKYLRLRRQTFIDICGDLPVTAYYPRHMQTYVNAMKCWPANNTKRAAMKGKNTKEILDANSDLSQKPLTRKTLQDGYVANIKTMMCFGMAEYHYRNPFAGAKIIWPEVLKASTPREGVDGEVLRKVFRAGISAGTLDTAMLPLLSVLTSRRLGLLLYLQGSDIREKHGVVIAQTSGIVLVDGQWKRVPHKTDESMTFFVLHDFLSDIGFVDWARKQDGFLFAQVHTHPDPSKYASKVLNRLMVKCGAAGGQAEVFHSLRGDAIEDMRDANVQDRTRRLQAGHELNNDHDKYGHRALSAEACRRLATGPLPVEIEPEVFKGLDFDGLAKGRRTRGRPGAKKES